MRYYAPQPLPLLGEGRGERAIAGSLEPVNESRQGSKPSALQLMTDDMYVYSTCPFITGFVKLNLLRLVLLSWTKNLARF